MLLTRILIPGFQIWRHTQATSDLERLSFLTQVKLKQAFLATCDKSITTLDQPGLQAVSFLNHEGTLNEATYNPTEGVTEWRSMSVFKLDRSSGTLSLIRWEQSPLRTTKAFALTPTQLTAACLLPETRRVATKMRSLRLTQEPDKHTWRFQLVFAGTSPRGPIIVENDFALSPRVESNL